MGRDMHDQFPNDADAWAVLKDNFTDNAGLITKKDPMYRASVREMDAIDYLCDEWDYSYNGGV